MFDISDVSCYIFFRNTTFPKLVSFLPRVNGIKQGNLLYLAYVQVHSNRITALHQMFSFIHELLTPSGALFPRCSFCHIHRGYCKPMYQIWKNPIGSASQ
jgi:hypothetical protein